MTRATADVSQLRTAPDAMLSVTATFDHRYVDGIHTARSADAARAYYSDPTRFEPRSTPP